MKNEKILLIADIHENSKRKKALDVAKNSILKAIKGQKFDRVLSLGDEFNHLPSIEERISLAEFFNQLRKQTKRIDFILGTNRHTFEKENSYNNDWINLCKDFYQHEELEFGNLVFCHTEFKGLRYINGMLSKSERKVDKKKQYYSGHLHSGEQCSFENVTYLGSIYKTSFSEINDKKRIAIITGEEIEFIPIESRGMYEIELTGKNGKIKAKGLKEIKEKEIDLKIRAVSDSQSLGELHRQINKIKAKFDIEYYIEDIKINQIKNDVPEDLNKDVLLKKFCGERKHNYTLVEKELLNLSNNK